MQNEITTVQPLFNKDGGLSNPGWAKDLMLQYDRKDIKASSIRIKEWDYYYISDGCSVVSLTMADLAYIGLITVTYIDLEKKTEHSVTSMPLLPMGRLKLPNTTHHGDVRYKDKKIEMEFIRKEKGRHLKCYVPNFINNEPFTGDFFLEQPSMDTMVIATPWKEDNKAFYYNQKINCMPVIGTFKIGSTEYNFTPDKTFSTMDWGRGVWTYDNTWYWGTANGIVHDENGPGNFGFNIGYGFGDTSRASENMIFFRNKAHKFDRITFNIPDEGYCSENHPWLFTTSDGRLEMRMDTIIDRHAYTKVGPICNDGHQVFGKFSGVAILDDGKKLQFSDLMGFAEKVHNRY